MRLTAAQIRASVIRLFEAEDTACFSEFTVKTGRRLDLICLAADGLITAVEIKSSVADFRSDQKWQTYLEWADQFYFAVSDEFPSEILPNVDIAGCIISDGFDAVIDRPAPLAKLAGARRNSLIKQLARRSMRRATRLSGDDDVLLAADMRSGDQTRG